MEKRPENVVYTFNRHYVAEIARRDLLSSSMSSSFNPDDDAIPGDPWKTVFLVCELVLSIDPSANGISRTGMSPHRCPSTL